MCRAGLPNAWLRKSIDADRNAPWPVFYIAACLARLGRIDEARKKVEAGLAVDPNFTIRRLFSLVESDNLVYLAQLAGVEEAMRSGDETHFVPTMAAWARTLVLIQANPVGALSAL